MSDDVDTKNAKPTILSRINIVMALTLLPLALIAVLDVVVTQHVTRMRELVIERELPNALNAVEMSDRLHKMHGNLLDYVLGTVKAKQDFYNNYDAYAQAQLNIHSDVPANIKLAAVDRMVSEAIKIAEKDIFGFDTSVTDRVLHRAQNINLKYVEPINKLLDEYNTALIASVKQDAKDRKLTTESIESLLLVHRMSQLLNSANNSLMLLTAKNPEATPRFIVKTHKLKRLFSQLEEHPDKHRANREFYTEIEELIGIFKSEGMALVQSFDTEAYFNALLAINDIRHTLFFDAESILEKHAEQAQLKVKDSLESIDHKANLFEQVSFICILVTALSNFMCLLYLRKRVIHPIRTTTREIGQLRAGRRDLHFDQEVDTREIAEMNSNLAQFQQQLIELDRLQEKQMDEVERQHLKELEAANEELVFLLQEKQLASDRLEQVNSDLAQFVHVASHDLREPLIKLGGLCSLLTEEVESGNTTESKQLLAMLNQNAKAICHLIDDLRSLAAIDDTKLALDDCDLNDVVNKVIDANSTTIEEHSTTIDVEALPTIRAHTPFLKKVFEILILNAVVHNEPPVHISISAEKTAGGWQFCVKNTNHQVLEKSERFFLPFVKGKRNSDGAGMGLTICKRIIELHGGFIWIDSSAEQQFTVFFELYSIEEKNNENPPIPLPSQPIFEE